MRIPVMVAVWLAVMSPVAGQGLTLSEGVRKAAEYVAAYRVKVSGASLEERLLLTELDPARRQAPQRIDSDVVLLNITDRLLSLRDLFAIDTRALRPREPRIVTRLAPPTQAGWQAAQEFSRENANYLLANVVLWFSDPVIALRFIEAEHQPRMTYTLDGRKRINGVQVSGIRFQERLEKDTIYLLDTPGNPRASGRIWIDPATGAIHQTELWIESKTDTARIQVVYAPDTALGMLLPREATATFDARERGTGITSMGSGGAGTRMTFDAIATYANARYTPIDLSKITK